MAFDGFGAGEVEPAAGGEFVEEEFEVFEGGVEPGGAGGEVGGGAVAGEGEEVVDEVGFGVGGVEDLEGVAHFAADGLGEVEGEVGFGEEGVEVGELCGGGVGEEGEFPDGVGGDVEDGGGDELGHEAVVGLGVGETEEGVDVGEGALVVLEGEGDGGVVAEGVGDLEGFGDV